MEFVGDKVVNFKLSGTPPLNLKSRTEMALINKAEQKRQRKNAKRLETRNK